jgi:poly(3-hydroxybutyrate) depolymerase
VITLLLVFPAQLGQEMKRSNRNHLLGSVHIERINERFFLWAQPESPLPAHGYPVVFLLHGAAQHAFSWMFGLTAWSKAQLSFTNHALQEGFFVIMLESQRPVTPGPRAWDVFEQNITQNQDIEYITNIISWLSTTKSDVVNSTHLYCTGFSSGAFMCSRLGLSADHLFSAIALNSGCNADSIRLTNRGPEFNFTFSHNLSKTHPPTLLLHGEQDRLVPVQGSITYHADLQRAGVETFLLVNPDNGHIWLKEYNEEIINWFITH